jgi:hypothetical protein
MKPGVLCLLLLPACSFLSPSNDPETYEYALTWFCVSPDGCEHEEELTWIDRVSIDDFMFHFTSTQDETFSEDAMRVASDTLGVGCSWLYYLSVLGHDLERSKFCVAPGGFELELAIPNEDPATHSQWVVSGRDLSLL